MTNHVVIIHGLNNSKESFYPLKKSLSSLGFKVHLINLPGHKKMNKNLSLNNSLAYVVKQFDKLKLDKFYCIGFSQGGLTLELLPERIKLKIEKQILLAPALAIRQSNFLSRLINVLPAQWQFLSFTPKQISRFSWLSVAYVKLLFKQIKQYNSHPRSQVRTLVLIDKKDELVDVIKIKSIVTRNKPYWSIEFIKRKSLKKYVLGRGHIVFHPDYFSPEEWNVFIEKITNFLL